MKKQHQSQKIKIPVIIIETEKEKEKKEQGSAKKKGSPSRIEEGRDTVMIYIDVAFTGDGMVALIYYDI